MGHCAGIMWVLPTEGLILLHGKSTHLHSPLHVPEKHRKVKLLDSPFSDTLWLVQFIPQGGFQGQVGGYGIMIVLDLL